MKWGELPLQKQESEGIAVYIGAYVSVEWTVELDSRFSVREPKA